MPPRSPWQKSRQVECFAVGQAVSPVVQDLQHITSLDMPWSSLKACIAKTTRRYDFPDKRKVDSSHAHKLRDLIVIAGLDEEHLEHTRSDPDFRKNWEIVQAWSEESRYRRHRPDAAEKLLGAIGDRRHGVISWIKLQW
jgi:hypothetical protein